MFRLKREDGMTRDQAPGRMQSRAPFVADQWLQNDDKSHLRCVLGTPTMECTESRSLTNCKLR